MTAVTLFNTLENLKVKFKWHLQQDILEGYQSIKVAKLEDAERQDTVTVMVNTYQLHGALKVTRKVLEMINRNDLVQSLPDTSSGPEESVDVSDVGETSENRGTPSSQSKDGMVPEPKPARHISKYQETIQPNFKDRYKELQEGLKEVKQLLDEMYTHLTVTAGGGVHINRQHEVMQIETMKPVDTETTIKPCDMFKHPSGKDRPIRTVLTKGIAGIGKTFLVHKFVLDWAEGRANQDVHLVFTFRQLNSLKGDKVCLADLIHGCIWETKDITKEALNHIFAALQSTGNTNFDKSEFKLLFVLDGLDGSRLDLDCSTNEIHAGEFDVTRPTSVGELLMNLIKKKLLPSARLWITTRPAAANQIHSDFVDITTEVRGFSDPEKEEYFRKRIADKEQAGRIISHIKTSRSLHIMCHIPVFCWITATVLEKVIKTREVGELPKTLTEMYAEFLQFQIHQTEKKCDRKEYVPEKCIQYIESLAKLAYHQLEKGNLIFYEEDLEESGIDVSGASVCSGVLTDIFKEESWRKNCKKKMFSFVHLSVQEFLAALHVESAVIKRNKNVMFGQSLLEIVRMFLNKRSMMSKVHRFAIDKALQSPNGHLDLFLRFLLGLSLQTNQDLFQNLLTQTGRSSETNQETVEYIKKKISENLSAERSINVFHCLNELNDRSLVEEIQQSLSSGSLSTDELSPAQWSALGFILLSSEDLDVFDLKKYSASEEVLLRLLPVIKASKKALLSGCNLSERSCEALSSVLSSESSGLRELDLSNNDLKDSGGKVLSTGVKSPHCKLQTLSLSGCLITVEGCTSLASALSSNPSHLRVLDMSYNHPGDSGVKMLSARLEDPHCRLDTLRLDHCGEQWLKPGLRKCMLNSCQLTLDTNTVSRKLKLSDNNRKVTLVKEDQSYPDHPERFDWWPQLLCRDGLTGRCYWEVERRGRVDISVSYRGIRRRGDSRDCGFGCNDQSWSLRSSDDRYSVWHNNRETSISSSSVSGRVADISSSSVSGRVADISSSSVSDRVADISSSSVSGRVADISSSSVSGRVADISSSSVSDRVADISSSSVSDRVAVYVDCPAGSVSFYSVSSDSLIHLHTFNTTFTQPLYPGFGFGSGSSVSLSPLEDGESPPVSHS